MISQLSWLKFLVFFSLIIYICVSTDKVATDLLVLFQMFQKFTKSVCMIRSMVFLKIIFQDINADFVAVSITKILFDINFCDLFLSEYNSEFSNFVGDTTPYECGENYVEVINKLEDAIESLRIIYQDKKSDFETWLKNDIVSQFTWETYIISSLKFTKVKIIFLQERYFLLSRKWELQLMFYSSCFQKHESNIVWERDNIKLNSFYY